MQLSKGTLLTVIQTDRVPYPQHPRARLSNFDRQNAKSKKKMNRHRHLKGTDGRHWCLGATRCLCLATVDRLRLSKGQLCWTGRRCIIAGCVRQQSLTVAMEHGTGVLDTVTRSAAAFVHYHNTVLYQQLLRKNTKEGASTHHMK